MTTVNFQQFWGYAKAPVPCTQCGKISHRHVREYCTVNPFNKNEAGQIKGPAEVLADAQAHADREAARQVAEGRVCRLCNNIAKQDQPA